MERQGVDDGQEMMRHLIRCPFQVPSFFCPLFFARCSLPFVLCPLFFVPWLLRCLGDAQGRQVQLEVLAVQSATVTMLRHT